jgi:hypothetical protein
MSPPQAPSNLHAYSNTRLQLDVLQWDPSASASVSGYDVFSTTSVGGTWTLIGTVNASANEIGLALGTPNATEYYRVRAVGTNNVPSAFTSSLTLARTDWANMEPAPTRPQNGPRGDF